MDKKRLKNKAENYGINLSENILDCCAEYAKIMLDYNKNINITAITEEEEIEDKHFIDSFILAFLPEIQGNILDVGSGAGFPGVVIKICNPDVQLTLIESNNKKVKFLRHLCAHLGLEVEIRAQRAEDVARTSSRESYDLVTARAVSALPVLSELCLPLVKPGGWFVPMKGRNIDEYEEAKNAISLLGGACRKERSYTLPDGSVRNLFFIEKIKATEKMYPRQMAKIKKTPL